MTKLTSEMVGGLRTLLDRSKEQIALALPKHLTPERMIRVAMTAYQRQQQLWDCTTISIVQCVIQASELGLEISGPLGHAYMVPYKNRNTGKTEAQFQVGYRGYLDLAFRSGKVETFCAHIVNANDHFKYRLGSKPLIEHVPTLDEPGDCIAVYAVVRLRGGGMDCDIMSKMAIDTHRGRYSKQRDTEFNPWNTAWNEMAKKTVIRRLAKRVPLSIELTRAAVVDEYAEAGVSKDSYQELPSASFGGHGNLPNRTAADAAMALTNGARETQPEPAPVDREPGVETE